MPPHHAVAITGISRVARISRLAVSLPAYRFAPDKRAFASWARRELEASGCMFVKIGQWVSSRTDVFPATLTDEFAKLRTAVAPMEADLARAIVDADLPGVLADFDPAPISCGSIAQVHTASLGGARVAVKVQRPGLLASLEADVALVTWLVAPYRWANPKLHADLAQSLRDLETAIRAELDFEAEAAHMRRFRDFFRGSDVRVPRVRRVSPRVVVMEYVPSLPVAADAGAAPGAVPARLIRLFFRQFFELGYLHTDLHAGNLGLAGSRLVLYDFGSVMRIPPDLRACIKHLMVSYLNRNVGVMVDYMLEYDMLRVDGPVSRAQRSMLEAFVANVIGYVEVTDIAQFAAVMKTIPVPSGGAIEFRPEVFLIFRTFTLLEGLCKELDPDFVILDAVAPLTAAFARDPDVLRLKLEDDLRAVFWR